MSDMGHFEDALFGSSTMIWDALAYRGARLGPTAARKNGPQFGASTAGEIDDGRERILDVAENLIRRFGCAKTTMANIAWELSMSRSSLYHVFSTKKTIEEAVFARVVARTLAQVRKVLEDEWRASARLAMVLTEMGRQTSSRMTSEPHLDRLVNDAFRNRWPAATVYLREVNGLIEEIVQHGVATGEFSSGKPPEMTKFISGSMPVFVRSGFTELMSFDGDDLAVDPATHVKMMIEFLTRGGQ